MYVSRGSYCISCGKCQDICSGNNVIHEGEHFFYIDETKCSNCGKCMTVCPMTAIVKTEEKVSENLPKGLQYTEKPIVFFEKAGKKNTAKVLELAKERALSLNIRDVVLPTTTGKSALEAIDFFGPDFNIVVIPCMYGRFKPGEHTLEPEYEKKIA